MKTMPLITRLDRTARVAALLLGLAALFVSAGCEGIAEGVAEAPFEKAMRQGRMMPSEYLRERENIRRALEPSR